MAPILCNVYKSSREADLYLYVAREEGTARVPDPLLLRFGEPLLVLTLEISAQRKLAQADAGKVLAAIADSGYYLQLPPRSDGYMRELRARNDKLPR